ncbi:hypothetical protein F5146DRAFT_547130 [Armillaria mellea]|nr:hypothetical protein F5146DRAFT_547130 [Armillaria mellea]
MEVRGRDALFVWSLRTLTLTPIIAPLWVPVPFPAFILLNGCMFYAEICPNKRVSDLRKECCNCDESTLDESQEAGHEWAVDNHAGCVSFLSLMTPSILTDLRLKSWIYAPFRSPRRVETLSFSSVEKGPIQSRRICAIAMTRRIAIQRRHCESR